ncbi:MAG TPA: TIGR03435 family protein [Vicinamibacterales bacterium]|nr:TIGR03435 family protein [Vicinamibacterales bacterium]
MKPAAIALFLVAPAVLDALPPSQQREANPAAAFDVASIKRSNAQATEWSYGSQPGGRWSMRNSPIATLIRAAYPAESRRIVGAPDWVEREAYDIEAKAEGEPSEDRINLMLQSLLAERFQFAAHYAPIEEDVFELVTIQSDDRRRAAMRPSTLDCDAIRDARRAGKPFEGTPPANGAPACGWSSTNGQSYRFGGVTMSVFARTLNPDGRVVIDKTGLAGQYEFTLRYSREIDTTDNLPSIFVALREQLGLRLMPGKSMLRAVIVDRIERPTEN